MAASHTLREAGRTHRGRQAADSSSSSTAGWSRRWDDAESQLFLGRLSHAQLAAEKDG